MLFTVWKIVYRWLLVKWYLLSCFFASLNQLSNLLLRIKTFNNIAQEVLKQSIDWRSLKRLPTNYKTSDIEVASEGDDVTVLLFVLQQIQIYCPENK